MGKKKNYYLGKTYISEMKIINVEFLVTNIKILKYITMITIKK